MFDAVLAWIERHPTWVVAAILAGRAAFLFGNGLDLIGDEAYYWEWSRRPDWCYFSKPPMVAWLIGASTSVFGHHPVSVRLPALVLGTVFLVFFHSTARAFAGPRAAALALLLVVATPTQVLANLLMTIDAPLFCFWIIAVRGLQRALFENDSTAWVWAGCASAAALFSKQTAIALPIGVALFLWTEPTRHSGSLRQFRNYLAPVLLAAVPLLLWNHQHDWLMFGHTRSHFALASAAGGLDRVRQAGSFLLLQLLLLTPISFALLLFTSVRMGFAFRSLSAQQRWLWWLGPLPLLAALGLACLRKVEGNWPLPFYFTALILVVGHPLVGAWRRVLNVAVAVGLLMLLLTYSLPTLGPALDPKGGALDPTRRLRGWHELAQKVHAERERHHLDRDDTFIVALGHRNLASQLAFYLPDQPEVYRFEESGRVVSQYELWPGPQRFVGKNAMLVAEGKGATVPEPLRASFERVSLLAEVANPRRPEAPLSIHLAENLRAWPAGPARGSIR